MDLPETDALELALPIARALVAVQTSLLGLVNEMPAEKRGELLKTVHAVGEHLDVLVAKMDQALKRRMSGIGLK